MADNKDKIVPVDSRTMYIQDMGRYSLYVLYNRYVPDIRDGLKPVQRRILTSMFYDIHCVSLNSKRKSANTVGSVMGKYHPHSDASIYGAFKPLANWFECKVPLISYDSNSGSIQGGEHAAMRYTETYMSKFAVENVIGELAESKSVVDWSSTFDNHNMEPDFLPVKVPLLLVNGIFAIAIGSKVESASHSLNDVIDATLTLLHNPNAEIVLIPDPCMKCEIVDTDWKKISESGFGYYVCRGIIDIEPGDKGGYNLVVRSTPDSIWWDGIYAKINELISAKKILGIDGIKDYSTQDELCIKILLKKGIDPNYMKQLLYKTTSLQVTKRINLQVIDGLEIKNVSYKEYILHFLETRRNTKFRLYNYKVSKCKTRAHQVDAFIKLLKSGDIENIIHQIRTRKSGDENALIEWLIKKLNITDLQASFIIHTEIGRLSVSHLKKYEEEQKALFEKIDYYCNIIANPKLIDKEIEEELLEIKRNYGKPRQSIIISESQASDIPEGQFKVVVTEQNYIKKLNINDPIKTAKGDSPKTIIMGDNSKDIILFDDMGKVFKLPIHKIPLSDKNSIGMDIRLLLKKCTSNIITIMYAPDIEAVNNKKRTKFYCITVSKRGMIKKMDLDDIINSTLSGIIYAKLAQGDQIADVIVSNGLADVVVYTKSKVCRFNMNNIPHLKRSTIGNQSIKSKDDVIGMSIIAPNNSNLAIITTGGKINKISNEILPLSARSRAGSSVIKLAKGDVIKCIYGCNEDDVITLVRADEVINVNVKDISIGSTISQGVKVCKDGVIKCSIGKIF